MLFFWYRISAICGDYYIGGRRFDSMALLVGYYTSCSYLLKGEQLKFPVSPPEVSAVVLKKTKLSSVKKKGTENVIVNNTTTSICQYVSVCFQ